MGKREKVTKQSPIVYSKPRESEVCEHGDYCNELNQILSEQPATKDELSAANLCGLTQNFDRQGNSQDSLNHANRDGRT